MQEVAEAGFPNGIFSLASLYVLNKQQREKKKGKKKKEEQKEKIKDENDENEKKIIPCDGFHSIDGKELEHCQEAEKDQDGLLWFDYDDKSNRLKYRFYF